MTNQKQVSPFWRTLTIILFVFILLSFIDLRFFGDHPNLFGWKPQPVGWMTGKTIASDFTNVPGSLVPFYSPDQSDSHLDIPQPDSGHVLVFLLRLGDHVTKQGSEIKANNFYKIIGDEVKPLPDYIGFYVKGDNSANKFTVTFASRQVIGSDQKEHLVFSSGCMIAEVSLSDLHYAINYMLLHKPLGVTVFDDPNSDVEDLVSTTQHVVRYQTIAKP